MNELIAELKERKVMLEATFEERDEIYGDDFDAMDASGGNFDDAYSLGIEHGEEDGEYSTICEVLRKLESLD